MGCPMQSRESGVLAHITCNSHCKGASRKGSQHGWSHILNWTASLSPDCSISRSASCECIWEGQQKMDPATLKDGWALSPTVFALWHSASEFFFLKKKSIGTGSVQVKLLPARLASHMHADSSPGCSASNPVPLSSAWAKQKLLQMFVSLPPTQEA